MLLEQLLVSRSDRESKITWVSPLSTADSLTFCSVLLCCERRGSARKASQSWRGAAAGRDYNGKQFWQRERLFPLNAETLAVFQMHSSQKASFRGKLRSTGFRMRKHASVLCWLFFFSLSVWKPSWTVKRFVSSGLPHIQSDSLL